MDTDFGISAASHQHEAVAEQIKSLCQKSEYFKQQVHDLKRKRASLEESRQTLLKQNQEVDGEIHKYKSSLEEKTSHCSVHLERTSALREKLTAQTKIKKDLHYANLWIRTGTACGAIFHTFQLRDDLRTLKRKMFTSEEFKKHIGDVAAVLSTDDAIVSNLQSAAKLSESNLAALAKETALIEPARLTYQEKEQVKELISSCKLEDNEKKLTQLTLLLCAVNKLDIPETISETFLNEQDDYYGSKNTNDDNNANNNNTNAGYSATNSAGTVLAQRRSDASTAVGSPGNFDHDQTS